MPKPTYNNFNNLKEPLVTEAVLLNNLLSLTDDDDNGHLLNWRLQCISRQSASAIVQIHFLTNPNPRQCRVSTRVV